MWIDYNLLARSKGGKIICAGFRSLLISCQPELGISLRDWNHMAMVGDFRGKILVYPKYAKVFGPKSIPSIMGLLNIFKCSPIQFIRIDHDSILS